MLTEFHVENFGLLEEVNITFDQGLTVFTGETGAGKSMLIDALSILLGGRANTDLIRHGEEKAKIEGVFTNLAQPVLERLHEAGYTPEDDQLFLFREINATGKNSCRVQGRSVPLSLYRSLCEGLVDIHGQMEHQSLLNEKTHRELLDLFGGSELLDPIQQLNRTVDSYRKIVQREKKLLVSEAEREYREEMLTFQIQEIDRVNPIPGEEEQLSQEKKRLVNSERILSLITNSYHNLYGGSAGQAVYDLLGQTRKNIQDLIRMDSDCNPYLDQVESIYYAVESLSEELRSYQESFEFEPGRLEQIEERLVDLHRLRKYGDSIEAILQKRDDMAKELEQLTNVQEELETLAKEKKRVLDDYWSLAGKLTKKRLEQAKRLENDLRQELIDLGLEQGRLELKFNSLEEPAHGGAEDVVFYFSANMGEPPKPLAKVASGGELSRLMLALKSLLAAIETVDTFIFDEVDSGVGGLTIQKVAEKLAKIGEVKQVFCITHAAVVAAYGDQHYGILKEVSQQRTRTRVKALSEGERINELARMLGGGNAEITYKHAKELWECSIRKS